MQFPWKKEESELEREVQHHLDELAARYQREGMSARDARLRAKKEFGGAEQFKEQCRDESAWAWTTGLTRDLTFGWRMIRKAPIVSAAAVLSLALGIGSNTAIFSLMHEALFRTIAAPAPEQLSVVLWQSKARAEGLVQGSSGSNYTEDGLRVADYFPTRPSRAKTSPKAAIGAHMYPESLSLSYADLPFVDPPSGRRRVSSERGGDRFEQRKTWTFAGLWIRGTPRLSRFVVTPVLGSVRTPLAKVN